MRSIQVSTVHLGALSDVLSDMIEIADDRANRPKCRNPLCPSPSYADCSYSPNEREVRNRAKRLLILLNKKIDRDGPVGGRNPRRLGDD
jgi:hypothetical protein